MRPHPVGPVILCFALALSTHEHCLVILGIDIDEVLQLQHMNAVIGIVMESSSNAIGHDFLDQDSAKMPSLDTASMGFSQYEGNFSFSVFLGTIPLQRPIRSVVH